MQGASEPTPDEEPWPGVAEVGCGLESVTWDAKSICLNGQKDLSDYASEKHQ